MKLLSLLFLSALAISATPRISIPVAFEPNRGQASAPAEFVTRAPGYTLALHQGSADFMVHGTRISATPLRALPSTAIPEQLLPATSTYLKGAPERWLHDLPLYTRVRYPRLYPGIDLVYYGAPSGLEYDFILAPHADPRHIRLALTGARRLHLDRAGDLLIETASGTLRQQRPVAYQETGGVRRSVRVSYALAGDILRFQLGPYDHSRPLTIDPTLTWAGYTGTAQSTVYDDAQAVAIDPTGNLYAAGTTVDPTYGDDDIFIVKLDTNGALINRAVIGGEGDDDAYGIAVDATGIYFTGYSTSVQWQIDSSHGGAGADGLYGKIDAAFSTYVYVGYFGGNGTDVGYSCSADASGNLWFGGVTNSTDFPVTRGSTQTTGAGGYDGFLAKLDPTGQVLYATYLGGSADDYVYSVTTDTAGNIYATGQTASSNLRTTSGAFQAAAGGGLDAFVAKYAGSGSLSWLTYLGGSGDDEANSIAVDASGAPAVTGGTTSTNFPTASPYQGSSAGGARDMFVTRLSPDGTQLLWSTYLGGSGDDLGNTIVLDSAGNPYIGGTSNSTNFPTASSWQSTNRGGADGTVTELSADGKTLLFSSYFGGSASDYVNAMAVNCTTGLIVAGSTQSTNFPSTLGTAPALAYSQGAAIGYVAKIAAGNAATSIAAGGIVNAATSSANPVAPGSLVSIYGTNLAGATGSAASTPLPTSLNNVSVTVNGATVPLVYVSPTQINFQLPYEAATGTASATVNSGCGPSAAVTFPVASAAPYLFASGTGDAIVQNQDYTFNSASNPAPKSSIVVVYLIGIGPLDKPITTGAATPADLFRPTLPSKALIGGFDTSIKFLGMTPGFVGLAQANLEIPNLSPGKYPIVITVNGIDSNAASIYVK